MLRLIWIFRFVAGKFFGGKKLVAGGMALSGEKVFKVRQCGSELEFENVSEDFVRHYFGLNDDLAQISRCIGKDDYIEGRSAQV